MRPDTPHFGDYLDLLDPVADILLLQDAHAQASTQHGMPMDETLESAVKRARTDPTTYIARVKAFNTRCEAATSVTTPNPFANLWDNHKQAAAALALPQSLLQAPAIAAWLSRELGLLHSNIVAEQRHADQQATFHIQHSFQLPIQLTPGAETDADGGTPTLPDPPEQAGRRAASYLYLLAGLSLASNEQPTQLVQSMLAPYENIWRNNSELLQLLGLVTGLASRKPERRVNAFGCALYPRHQVSPPSATNLANQLTSELNVWIDRIQELGPSLDFTTPSNYATRTELDSLAFLLRYYNGLLGKDDADFPDKLARLFWLIDEHGNPLPRLSRILKGPKPLDRLRRLAKSDKYADPPPFMPRVQALFAALPPTGTTPWLDICFGFYESKRSSIHRMWTFAALDEEKPASRHAKAKIRKLIQLHRVLAPLSIHAHLTAAEPPAVRPLVYLFSDRNRPAILTTSPTAACRAVMWPDQSSHPEAVADDAPQPLTPSSDSVAEIKYRAGVASLVGRFDVRLELLSKDDSGARPGLPPFAALDDAHARLAALIVDVGEGHDEEHSRHVETFLRVLALRYPSVVTFALSASPSYTRRLVEEHAAWALGLDHASIGDASDTHPLRWYALHGSLRAVMTARYGSFRETPFPNQLVIPTGHRVLRQLDVRLPIDSTDQGLALQRLVACLFPDADRVEAGDVFSSGKSGAQATLLVKCSRRDKPAATRFIKVARWAKIQRECSAYERAIRPRLGSYVGNVIGTPVLSSPAKPREMPWGALTYSTVGLPETAVKLRSLEKEITKQQALPAGTTPARYRQGLCATIDHVLTRLHGDPATLRDESPMRPLWSLLGHVLPPLFTGQLILDRSDRPPTTLSDYSFKGFRQDAACILASRDIHTVRSMLKGKGGGVRVRLDGFLLEEATWSRAPGSGELTVVHPNVGARIRLRGAREQVRPYGETWVKPGMPCVVDAQLDDENKDLTRIRERVDIGTQRLYQHQPGAPNPPASQTLLAEFASVAGHTGGEINPLDALLGESALPFWFGVRARDGAIHGDLNLENILFSGDDPTGWLIDFEYANEAGMIAFDYAKLEVELWSHHIHPRLLRLGAYKPTVKSTLRYLAGCLHVAQASADPRAVLVARFGQTVGTYIATELGDLLGAVQDIRERAKRNKVTTRELTWALFAYATASSKFTFADERVSAMTFLTGAWHARDLLPNESAAAGAVDVLTKRGASALCALDKLALVVAATRIRRSPHD